VLRNPVEFDLVVHDQALMHLAQCECGRDVGARAPAAYPLFARALRLIISRPVIAAVSLMQHSPMALLGLERVGLRCAAMGSGEQRLGPS
jgi:hypothetical protein